MVKRTRNRLAVTSENAFLNFGVKPSKTFTILGTLSLGMAALLLFSVQPSYTTVQAAENSRATLYSEFHDINSFPKTEQVALKQLAEQNKGEYIVKDGDSVNSICLQLATDCEAFKDSNQLAYPYNLTNGQKLVFRK